MKILQGRWILLTATVAAMLLMQACAQQTAVTGKGESFAAATEANAQISEPKSEAAIPADDPVAESPVASAELPASSTPEKLPAATPTAVLEAVQSPSTEKKEAADKAGSTAAPSAKLRDIKTTAQVSSRPAPASVSPSAGDKTGRASISPTPAKSSKPTASAPGEQDKAKAAAASVSSSADGTSIDWDGFFDGSDQTRPSERFWDLSGSRVTIKGFMGEVLSFEKNWFLLIPEPGAECPFDNGDETYWNKIMIVFVPEGSKLRHTSEPLQLSGRLDVGIKIDESGYKTMFRLYDASFSPIE